MVAKKNGKNYFQISTGGDPEKLKKLCDAVYQKFLETMQTAIVLAANTGDDAALQHLQACCSELFKRAFECRASSKKMKIVDDYQGPPLQ